MNTQKLKFFLDYGEGLYEAFPIYGDNVSLDYERESGQKFLRKKFNGKLKFTGYDYNAIMAADFDQRFVVQIRIYDPEGNVVNANAFTGHFYKTDCEIDEGAYTIEVTPSPDDEYNAIFDGWEKEFNIPKLAPSITPITMQKRPVLQVYNKGRDTITCILSGMCWEQPCEATDDPSAYSFGLVQGQTAGWNQFPCILSIFGNNDTPLSLPNCFSWAPGQPSTTVRDGYYIYYWRENNPNPGAQYLYHFELRRQADNVILWETDAIEQDDLVSPFQYTMYPNIEEGMVGEWELQGAVVEIWARIICDVSNLIGGVQAGLIPDNDIVWDNLNYRYCVPYTPQDTVYLQLDMSEDPTEYGLSLGDEYYKKPYFNPVLGYGNILPISKSTWDEFSIWWIEDPAYWLIEEQGRANFILEDAYPLASVISVLLDKINAGVTFDATSAYSDFLYSGSNVLRGNDTTELFITPKSNLVSAEYENAAQRGNLTLKQVFEMLRDVYRCFWFIEDGKLRIEHAAFFARGGNYIGPMSVGLDLTTQIFTRTQKSVASGQQTYKFDKPETYSRIELSWMDDVTAPFEGAIDIISGFVLKEKKEEVNISQFTSDIDYILLNANEVSKDGFALIGAWKIAGAWKVPYVDFGDNEELLLQNGYLAFKWLNRYYMYDLAAPDYEIDGEAGTASGVMPLKTQEVTFPSPVISGGASLVPDALHLIRTLVGEGEVRKMSLNLTSLSIKATLNYANT